MQRFIRATKAEKKNDPPEIDLLLLETKNASHAKLKYWIKIHFIVNWFDEFLLSKNVQWLIGC